MMAADPLVAEVHKIAMDAKQPPNVRVEALKLAIKLTGAFEAKQNVELSVLGAPKTMTFEDLAGSALVDVAETDEGDLYVEYRDGSSKLVPRSSIDDRTGVFMDLDMDEPLALPVARSEDIVDAEVVEDWPQPVVNKRDRAVFAEVERDRRHSRRERTPESVPPAPDKFGMVRDTSAEDAARRRSAAASRRADKTVRVERSTSTADPYADRSEPRRTRGSMSPKRWEERQKGRGNPTT